MTNITKGPEVQKLLDKAAGLTVEGGDARLKGIVRDLTEAVMLVIEKYDVNEGEFWTALNFLQEGAPEYGLIAPGLGLEHFLDLKMDAEDAEQGVHGGTPRTIEGPLFVEGAPMNEGEATMNAAGDPGDPLTVHGIVKGPDGAPVAGAIVDAWHANAKGLYSHFDPSQPAFNNRVKIKTGPDGRYVVRTFKPVGYAVPPGGASERLLGAIGRHGMRPAHVHLMVRAEGFRPLTTQINLSYDPIVYDDFAFGTRDGLVPDITDGANGSEIAFDLELVAGAPKLSTRPRAAA